MRSNAIFSRLLLFLIFHHKNILQKVYGSTLSIAQGDGRNQRSTYRMRNLKIVLSALALATAVGGSALAADGTATTQPTTTAAAPHATVVKHKVVRNKTTKKAEPAHTAAPAPAAGTH